MKRVFADTSYFIAMIAPNDALHQRAHHWGSQELQIVTTAWIATEIPAYLANTRNRGLFTKLLTAFRSNPRITFVPASVELFDIGADLYARRMDKSWSLVDCISFIVMQEQNLAEALSGDRHFVEAGFNALLLQD